MQKRLEQTIEELNQEINKLDAGKDAEIKNKISILVNELERLAREDPATHQDLTDSLQDTLTEFEISHPRITGILNQLMVTLSNMGI